MQTSRIFLPESPGTTGRSFGRAIAQTLAMSAMKVSDYMTRFLHTLGPDHSMVAAHRLMQRHNIRHLPVLENGKLLGVVSQRDLYFVESLTDSKANDMAVTEAMAIDVSVCKPSTSVSEVARTMVRDRVGSVVVVEGDKVVGIFTTIDALQALMEITEVSEEILASS